MCVCVCGWVVWVGGWLGVGVGGVRMGVCVFVCVGAYLTLHCHHPNEFCIKIGSNESHFDVSITARINAKRRYP